MLRDSTSRLKGSKEMWGPQPPWIQPGVVHSKVGLGNRHLPGLFGFTGMKDMMICEKDWFIMDIGGANGTIVAHQWAGFLMGSSEASFWENGFEMWRFLIWGQSWENILQLLCQLFDPGLAAIHEVPEAHGSTGKDCKLDGFNLKTAPAHFEQTRAASGRLHAIPWLHVCKRPFALARGEGGGHFSQTAAAPNCLRKRNPTHDTLNAQVSI